MVDICRDDETVMSELSRLEDVLCDTLVKCPQVRRVLVPAASNTVSALAWLRACIMLRISGNGVSFRMKGWECGQKFDLIPL